MKTPNPYSELRSSQLEEFLHPLLHLTISKEGTMEEKEQKKQKKKKKKQRRNYTAIIILSRKD
jgi:hypothetical protein